MDIEAFLTTVEARLIVANTAQAEDCDGARFLMGTGIDVYEDLITSLQIAPSIAQGRARYVTRDWQSFNTVLVPGQDRSYLDQFPPPLE